MHLTNIRGGLIKLTITALSFCLANVCSAQKEKHPPAVDTTFSNYDELFNELDLLLDSLAEPQNVTLFNLSAGPSFLSYETRNASQPISQQKINISPSLGFFHRSGLGVTGGATIIRDSSGINPYQYFVSGSFDYARNHSWISGIAYTRYFTKENLSFYTSPLQNEVYGYFTYRDLWFKPSVNVAYGWGNRKGLEQLQSMIIELKQKKNTNNGNGNGNGGGGGGNGGADTTITTVDNLFNEKVIDLNLAVSVRHDFYFMHALSSDHIKLTPQISFVNGSQQFGFNQTSTTYTSSSKNNRNVLVNTENNSFDNEFRFQPIAVTTFLKAEYKKGIFYLQPQLILDYYLQQTAKPFTTAFVVNCGLVF
jgi:hypothetical protein